MPGTRWAKLYSDEKMGFTHRCVHFSTLAFWRTEKTSNRLKMNIFFLHNPFAIHVGTSWRVKSTSMSNAYRLRPKLYRQRSKLSSWHRHTDDDIRIRILHSKNRNIYNLPTKPISSIEPEASTRRNSQRWGKNKVKIESSAQQATAWTASNMSMSYMEKTTHGDNNEGADVCQFYLI